MFETLKNFFIKRKTILFIMTLGLLSFFTNFWSPLWLVLCFVVSLFYITCDIGEFFCFIAIHTCLSGVSYLAYGICLGVGIVAAAVRYCFDVKKGRVKFYPLPFYLTTFIVCLFSLIIYEVDIFGLGDGLIIIALLYSFYFVFAYRKHISATKFFNYLILGLLVSLCIGLVLLPFKNALFYPIYYDEYYARLRLMTLHQNHLSFFCLMAIAYLIYNIFNKKGKSLYNVVFIVLFLAMGILTLSKAFIAMIVIYCLYIFVFVIKSYKKQATKILVPFVVVICVIALIGNNFISKIFDRLFAYYESGTIIQNITTGRSRIWQGYINDILSSVIGLLFGRGIFAAEIMGIGIHSSYLFLLYRMGIVGVSLFMGLIFAYLKETNAKAHITYRNSLPLFSFLIIAVEENLFSERCFFILFFAIFLLFENERNKNMEKESE